MKTHMGLLENLLGLADPRALGQIAGYTVGCAIIRVGRNKPFETVVFCEHPDKSQIFYFSAAELEKWKTSEGKNYPRRGECVATAKGLSVKAIDVGPPLIDCEAHLTYSMEPAFELHTKASFSGFGKAMAIEVQTGFLEGLRANVAAMEVINGKPERDEAYQRFFANLVETSLREQGEKRQVLPDGRLEISQDTRCFEVLDPTLSVIARGRFQMIGTYVVERRAWRWAWDIPTIDAELSESVKQLRAWGVENEIPTLVDARTQCDLPQVEQLFAIAIHRMQASTFARLKISPMTTLYLALFDLEPVSN